jgi:exopolysaccharide production protein ExoQ
MLPQIATLLFAVGILGLFALNKDAKERTSPALWIPVIWLGIACSRMVSQWIAAIGTGATAHYSAEQILDGNPFDRALLTGLLVIGVAVLVKRGHKVAAMLQTNIPIIAFFLYCGISASWSDYADVSFKRWVKALGDLAMVLIVLTDTDPSVAVKRLMSRVGFVLIPASVLVSKYYTNLGRGFGEGGEAFYTGVASSKNELGGICLLFGLGAIWRLGGYFQERKRDRRLGVLIAQGMLLIMVMWLFWKAHTMTALACFLMAGILIIATRSSFVVRRIWIVHAMVLVMLLISVSALFLGVGSGLLTTMGKDATLTGRTAVWDLVLSLSKNPLIGTGFESFWLGPRLEKVWSVYWWHPNEAHDGYIEVYLNLGWIGATLLAILMLTGYRTVMSSLRRQPAPAGLRLAFLVVAIAYNFTESAVRIMHPVWICFLLATIAVPGGWVRAKAKKYVKPVPIADFSPCLEQV